MWNVGRFNIKGGREKRDGDDDQNEEMKKLKNTD